MKILTHRDQLPQDPTPSQYKQRVRLGADGHLVPLVYDPQARYWFGKDFWILRGNDLWYHLVPASVFAPNFWTLQYLGPLDSYWGDVSPHHVGAGYAAGMELHYWMFAMLHDLNWDGISPDYRMHVQGYIYAFNHDEGTPNWDSQPPTFGWADTEFLTSIPGGNSWWRPVESQSWKKLNVFSLPTDREAIYPTFYGKMDLNAPASGRMKNGCMKIRWAVPPPTAAKSIAIPYGVVGQAGRSIALPYSVLQSILPYNQEVLNDNPYAYWRMGDAVGPLQDATVGNRDMTIDGTLDVVGALAGAQNDGAVSFNGVDDAGSVALDLSDTQAITIDGWILWDGPYNSSDDDLLLEFSSNWNNVAGTFIIDMHNSSEAGTISFGLHTSTTFNTNKFRGTIPQSAVSAGVWHHVGFVFDITTPALKCYVDGTAVTVTMRESQAVSGNFANSTLYVMSRNATSLRGAGDVDELAIYKSELPPARMLAHYQAGITP